MKFRWSCSFLMCLFIPLRVEGTPFPFRDVYSRDGPVRGLLNFTLLNQSPYYSFRGIPFAQPPIGNLRFKPPQPIDSKRSETFNAFQYGHRCARIGVLHGYNSTHEDCLFLNVFVPVVAANERLAIIFHTFGGAFIDGTGDDLHSGPDFLVERGIILVTYNFRVGMLGFMSLGTPEFSGNMGLKDQQLALKWIYDNIEHFGGDKTRITVSGHSSGSIMTSLQTINDQSRQYIHQVLLLSGTGNEYDTYLYGDHRCLIDIFAEQMLGSSYDYSMGNLTEFLRTVSVEDIISSELLNNFESVLALEFIWIPVIESRDAPQPFMTDIPLNILRNSTVDIGMYFSTTKREGLCLIYSSDLTPESINNFMQHPIVGFPVNNYTAALSEEPYLEGVMERIRDFYFENATTDFKRADAYVLLQTDFALLLDVMTWFNSHLAISTKDTYYQQFSVDSLLNTLKVSTFPGAGHGDELCYIFYCRNSLSTYRHIMDTQMTDKNSTIALNTIRRLTELISNFVRFGTPTVNDNPVRGFRPVRSNKLNFLDIRNDGLFLGISPHGNRIDFVNQVREEAIELIAAHGDTPEETVIQRYCNEIRNN